MADILINNMELPKKCHSLMVAIFSDGSVDYKDRDEMETHRTTAIELPPHGDLIERNELPIIGITDYKLEGHTVVEFEDVLNAPVIVEANT